MQPKPPVRLSPHRTYYGYVGAIGPEWVELRAGWMGTNPEQVAPRDKEPEQPKRLTVSGVLLGGDREALNKHGCHGLPDIALADGLFIISGLTPEKEERCLYIFIERRPSGKVPMRVWEPFPENGSHRRAQAEQDAEEAWDEKGIPIPQEHLDVLGRSLWSKTPYPPVSPMPRPAAKP
jgi:hypothetical protein